ncbi:MAG: glycosyltransferase, partial [Spirochaetota bacterium]
VPTFIYVGRLVASKGLNVLLDAARMLKDEGYIFGVQIVGRGEEWKALQRQCRRLQLQDKVDFRGQLDWQSLQESLAEARALVLPSISRLEAFGIVQQEALCLATPVIASDLPGVRQVILDTKGGWLVEPGNAFSLYQAMAYLLDNEAEAKQAGKQGAMMVAQKYAWEDLCCQVEEVYRTCLRNNVSVGKMVPLRQ